MQEYNDSLSFEVHMTRIQSDISMHKLTYCDSWLEGKPKMLYNMCSETFSFQDTDHRKTCYGV
jgi:hypothetical protein